MVVLRVGVEHNFREAAAELQTLPGKVDQAMRHAVDEGGSILKAAYERTINYREHPGEHTRDHIERSEVVAEGNSYVVNVGSDDEVATYLEYGTRPHIIRPRVGKVLHFVVDGREIFVSEVHHPGTPAYRPLLRATDDSEAAVYQTIEQRVGEAFDSLGRG